MEDGVYILIEQVVREEELISECWVQGGGCCCCCCHSQNPTVKVEPSSPVNTTTKKHKVYFTIDRQPIGHMNLVNDKLDLNLTNGKCQKMTTGTITQVRFDGVKVPEAAPSTQPTRKSTRSTATASTKKDIRQLV
jgi:hypothetical protein